jgi:pimeloyl-ACP methyl ester carboxylesterase
MLKAMPRVHSSGRAGVLAIAVALSAAMDARQQAVPAPAASSPASFTVFVRAMPVGSEQIAVERTAAGWTITSSGRIGAPLNIVNRRLQVRYDLDWRPLELILDATTNGQTSLLQTSVSGTTARSAVTSAGTPEETTDTIDGSAVLLARDAVFAPYAALAARLRSAAEESTIPGYVAPLGPMTIAVADSSSEKIQTLERVIEARRTRIALTMPDVPPLAAEIWSDESGRLLRVSVPAQGLEVVREDIASVSTRRITVSRPGDEQVRIPAEGFSLAGTLSKPADFDGKPRAAIVLVAGSSALDRDETVAGIPIFGQLAGDLADAGHLVLRYDKRGVGQSGGRPEAATVADYAEDLRAAVRFLAARKDVDRRRIAVTGYSDGGPIALVAASKEDRIGFLVLAAAPGTTGAELSLSQASRALERSNRTPAERQAAIDLQRAIQNAVLTGKGWEGISPELRRQADTAWFQSFLAFDPARLMRDIEQPILIVHGLLDTQVPPAHADRLEQLARGRRRGSVEVARLTGVNHLLVPATTGEVDEYVDLKDRRVSPDVARAIGAWLTKMSAASR